MKTLTLQEAAISLSIDITTLHRWVRRSGIEVRTDEGDKRRKVIAYADVQQLAKKHHRILDKHLKDKGEDARIEALESRVTSLERQIAAFTSKDATHSDNASSVSLQTQIDGMVGWRTFSRLHGIQESTIQKAIESGRLQMVKGEWKIGRIRFTGALNKQGQARFYQLYHTHHNFIPCSECPHS